MEIFLESCSFFELSLKKSEAEILSFCLQTTHVNPLWRAYRNSWRRSTVKRGERATKTRWRSLGNLASKKLPKTWWRGSWRRSLNENWLPGKRTSSRRKRSGRRGNARKSNYYHSFLLWSGINARTSPKWLKSHIQDLGQSFSRYEPFACWITYCISFSSNHSDGPSLKGIGDKRRFGRREERIREEEKVDSFFNVKASNFDRTRREVGAWVTPRLYAGPSFHFVVKLAMKKMTSPLVWICRIRSSIRSLDRSLKEESQTKGNQAENGNGNTSGHRRKAVKRGRSRRYLVKWKASSSSPWSSSSSSSS